MAESRPIVGAAAADWLLSQRDGTLALLYMYWMSKGTAYSPVEAAEFLGLSQTRVHSLMEKISVAGQSPSEFRPMADAAPVSDAMPDYNAADIAVRLETDPTFHALFEQVEARLGKLMSSADTATLFGIYDWLGMPADVIFLLVVYCIEDAESRIGYGRRPTMRQIERKARYWQQLGIDTTEMAVEFLKGDKLRKSDRRRIASLIGLGSRELSPSEEQYIDNWIGMRIGDELIYKAYDITMINTGMLRWKYMDAILRNWQSKGIKTLAELETLDSTASKQKSPENALPTEEELEQMRRLEKYRKDRPGDDTVQ